MEITDIIGMGEFGSKALDKIASACYWIAEPYQIKRIAKARATEALIQAKTNEDILDYSMLRSKLRENSITKAILNAANDLRDEEVSDQPMNPDWLLRWSDITGGYTTDQAIDLWSQILKRELKEANSISFRTMDTLKNMSSKEGEAFASITKFCLISDSDMFILNTLGEAPENIFNYNDLFLSQEAGLINLDISTSETFKKTSESDCKITIYYQNKKIEISFPNNVDDIIIPAFVLTTAGKELYPIANRKEISNDYFSVIENFLKERGLPYKIIDNN